MDFKHFGRKEKPLKPHEMSNDDLKGLSSQYWSKERENITLDDKRLSTIVFGISGMISDLAAKVLNNTEIENHQTFLDLWEKKNRPDGKGLLSVSNHLHYLDDPVIPVALFGDAYMKSVKSLLGDTSFFDNFRWMPAEKRNFFFHKNPVLRVIFRDFFGRGKVVPVLRGQGIKQDSFRCLTDRLREGDWVNIFGEGTRTKEYGQLLPFKPGIGALIKNAPQSIILPMGHDGMQDISPFGCGAEIVDPKTGEVKKDLINLNKRLQIVVGEPFSLEKEAAEVEDNLEGQLHLADLVREKVKVCYDRAIALNDHKKALEVR